MDENKRELLEIAVEFSCEEIFKEDLKKFIILKKIGNLLGNWNNKEQTQHRLVCFF